MMSIHGCRAISYQQSDLVHTGINNDPVNMRVSIQKHLFAQLYLDLSQTVWAAHLRSHHRIVHATTFEKQLKKLIDGKGFQLAEVSALKVFLSRIQWQQVTTIM